MDLVDNQAVQANQVDNQEVLLVEMNTPLKTIG